LFESFGIKKIPESFLPHDVRVLKYDLDFK